LTGGDLAVTAIAIMWVSAVASAVVDNIPFVATMIPLIENMTETFGGTEQLMPVWWSLAMGSCLGGNGSLIVPPFSIPRTVPHQKSLTCRVGFFLHDL
jgi:Na+/H+ antiporter NhaD/arsenite permease-like protein